MKQFNKAHYSLYLGVFSDLGYVIDRQTNQDNNLSNSLLWGNGISLDYVTYYDKLLRIEFSVNHLGEKEYFYTSQIHLDQKINYDNCYFWDSIP